MESDHSRAILERYFAMDERLITVTLRNGSLLTGVFIAFCKGDEYLDEPYITHWHLVEEKDKMSLGSNFLGMPLGQIIAHQDIATLYFHQDKSILKFDE
jgi:hypothetical protein